MKKSYSLILTIGLLGVSPNSYGTMTCDQATTFDECKEAHANQTSVNECITIYKASGAACAWAQGRNNPCFAQCY